MLIRFLFTIAFMSLCAQASATVIYTWVDENGKTHYSQQPPEQGQATKLYSEDMEQAPIGFIAPKVKESKTELSQAEKDAQIIKIQDEAQAKSLCESAKHKLNLLKTYDRLTRTNAETGEQVLLTDKEKALEKDQQLERVRLFCEDN